MKNVLNQPGRRSTGSAQTGTGRSMKLLSLSLLLLCTLIQFACGSDDGSDVTGNHGGGTPQPEPPAYVKAPVVDGEWLEESLTDMPEGYVRRLAFSSDGTYQQAVCDASGNVHGNVINGNYRIEGSYLIMDGSESYTFTFPSGNTLTLRSGSVTRSFRKYIYSEGIEKATGMAVTPGGMITGDELKRFKGYLFHSNKMKIPAGPADLDDNDLVFRESGKALEECIRMFEVTYDLTFLNRAIEFLDAAYYYRNGQPGGLNCTIKWSGEKNDVWPLLVKDDDNAANNYYDAAVEQGEALARFAYTARLILETPAIWDKRVAANDSYGFGPTYKQRAMTYLKMCDEMYEDWLTRFIHPGDNVFWRRNKEKLIESIAYNQALMACNGLDYMAQCHSLLGNNAKAAEYDKIVNGNISFFKRNARETKSPLGSTCLQWTYNYQTGIIEDLNHASLDANVMYNLYIGGRHPDIMNDLIVKMSNAVFDMVFAHGKDEQGRYPGRVNGVYDGKYNDGYVRDAFIQLADIRKDWYEKVIEIDKSRYPGNLAMVGRILWNKSRRTAAPANIGTQRNGSTVILTWAAPADGKVAVMRSYDLWSWNKVAEVSASAARYVDNTGLSAGTVYYRLVSLQDNKAGYSKLICVN